MLIVSRLNRSACLLAFMLLLLCGCDNGRLATHAVQGKFVFPDGSHPMFGDVEFYNAENKLNARGKISRDGTFTVGTYDDNDGAVAGNHQVIISQQTASHLTAKIKAQIDHDHGELVDQKYLDYRTSGLECTIEPGTNQVELTVQKMAKSR